MAFGHEELGVYRAAIEYVGWAYRLCEALSGHRNAKDQLLRASQAIPLNIAEGNGKGTDGGRGRPTYVPHRRFFVGQAPPPVRASCFWGVRFFACVV
jgi:hypothetical protein